MVWSLIVQTGAELGRSDYWNLIPSPQVSKRNKNNHATRAGAWAVATSAIMLATVTPSQAQSAGIRASFACAKAATTPERMICADAELARLDRIMSDLFTETRSLLLNSEQAAEADKTQRAWLAGRNRCGDVQCLRRAYLNRVTELARELPSDI